MESWLLLLSRARIGDPARAGDLAETVGDAVIQRSFLTVSAGYSVDELIEITEILSSTASADAETLAEEVRTDYLELAKFSGTNVASELLRQRAHRRDRQVRRKEEQVNAMTQDMEERIQQAKKLAENLEKVNGDLRADKESLQAANVRMQHTFWLVIALFIVASAVGGADGLGANRWVVAGGVLLCAGVGFEGYKWRSQPGNERPKLFIAGIAATICWVVLGGIVPLILS
jgi:hypothetical protein